MPSSLSTERVGSALAFSLVFATQCTLPDREVDPALECLGRLQESCSSTVRECGASEDCTRALRCLEQCAPGDTGCDLACASVSTETRPANAALFACFRATCGGEIGPAQGVFGGGACAECLADECRESVSDCSNDPACIERVACLSVSDNPADTDACLALPPSTAELDDSLVDCANDRCRARCGLGERFECIGGYDWPPPEQEVVTERFRVADRLVAPPNNGIADLVAQACRRIDPGCQMPADEQSTDADGLVTVSLPGLFDFNDFAFDGYVFFRQPATVDLDFMPTLLYRDRPSYRVREEVQEVPTAKRPGLELSLGITLGGLAPDPTRGHVAGQVFDCRGLQASPPPGLVIRAANADASTAVAYLRPRDQVPEPSLESTQAGVGRFVIANVPPGDRVEIIAEHPVHGLVGSIEVEVRPDHFTVMGIFPDTTDEAGAR